MTVVTPRQIRAARALLDLSQPELGEIAGVSKNTIQRIEAGLAVSTAVYFKVLRAIDNRGVEFIPETTNRGEGVRMRDPEKRPA